MSIFQTERPNDIYEKQRAIAEANRRRKEFLRNSIDQEKIKKYSESITESVNAIDAANESNKLSDIEKRRMDKLSSQRLNKTAFMLEHRLVEEGYEKCFNTAIFHMVYESCWIDDDVKQATIGQMVDAYKQVIEALDAVGIAKTSPENDTAFIKNVREVAMEAAKKSAKRIAKDACDTKEANGPESMKRIKFDMTEEESKDLQTNLADLGPEEITELVKDKVLTVIQDEQDAGERKAQIFNEIEDATGGANNSSDAKDTTSEDTGEIMEDPESETTEEESTDDTKKEESGDKKEEGTKESTSLLEALLAMDNTIRTETVTPVEESVQEEIVPEQKKSTIPDIITQEKIRRSNRFIGTSLFECIMIDATRTVSENVTTESVDVNDPNMIMDAAFMESVMTYTVLETFNTLKLYKFDNTSTRKLAEYFKHR